MLQSDDEGLVLPLFMESLSYYTYILIIQKVLHSIRKEAIISIKILYLLHKCKRFLFHLSPNFCKHHGGLSDIIESI